MSKKIVINTCYGGFSLSEQASELLPTLRYMQRDSPSLVKVVEELGSKSWGDCAELKVVEIPEDVEWEIVEYDGIEHIAEQHRTWY